LGEFGAVSVMSGRIVGQTETMTLHVENAYQNFDYTAAYASAVVLALVAIFTLTLMTASRPREGPSWPSPSPASPLASPTSPASPASPGGSLTALLGPSGSGKSTLLRVIAGLEQPDEGDVNILGEDATGVPARKRGVGFVFQHYAAFKHMTVEKNIAFGLDIRKNPKAETRKRVGELLELVQLQGLAKRYPSQL